MAHMFAIMSLAALLSIPGNIHAEKMMVMKANGYNIYLSNDDNLWETDHVDGLLSRQTVTIWMSDNDTPDYRYDDIIVMVENDLLG